MNSKSTSNKSYIIDSEKLVPLSGTPKLDYLTLKISNIVHYDTYSQYIALWLNESGLTLSNRRARLDPGYDLAFKITVLDKHNTLHSCGKLAYSIKYQRVILELTGLACDYIWAKDKDYGWLSSFAGQRDVVISRCDLAVDDYYGQSSITKVDKAYSKGLFNPVSGKKPKKVNLGTVAEGRTRYIGGRTAYKTLCVYEKSKQLGLADKLNWLRFEVRFRTNSRDVIPASVIRDRADFFFNAYPRFFKSLLTKLPKKSIVERRAIDYQSNLSKKIKSCRYQSGKIINVLSNQFTDNQVIDILIRPGVPKGLVLPDFVMESHLNDAFEFLDLEND